MAASETVEVMENEVVRRVAVSSIAWLGLQWNLALIGTRACERWREGPFVPAALRRRHET